MSEEESYNSKRLSDSSESSEEDDEDNESEYRDLLTVEPNMKPRKSSTFNSSQLNDRTLRFPSKLSTLYRQGTGNSDMTLGNNSGKGVILTSICTSKDGTKSEILINPVNLRAKIKKKYSLHFPSTKLKARNTFNFKSSNSSTNSKMMSISYRKSQIFKLGITPSVSTTLSNYVLMTSPAQKQQGNTNIKDIVITLHQMGFEDERVEKALFYGEIKSVEEAMYFLVPNKGGFWEHKFVPEEYCKGQDWCLFCKRQQEKRNNHSPKKFYSHRSSDKSKSEIGGEPKINDLEKLQLSMKNEPKIVIQMKDRTIISNKQYVQRKNQKRLNETFNTVSQLQVSSGKNNGKQSKDSSDKTPINYENDMTELNNNGLDENDDKTSQHNFDLSQRYDEMSEYHEINIIRDPLSKKQTVKICDDSSPKSCISEPMNNRSSI